MNKKQIIFSLIIICLISLGLKLYLVDFSIPVNSDNLGYTLNAIAHTNGDFSQSSHRGMGWSLFVSMFFGFIDSENFFDYSNTIRALSIGVATFSIPMMYMVGRKFFDERYYFFYPFRIDICASGIITGTTYKLEIAYPGFY